MEQVIGKAADPAKGEAGAPEIEVTPEMIEAGVNLLGESYLEIRRPSETTYSTLVVEIYRRMEAARLRCFAGARRTES